MRRGFSILLILVLGLGPLSSLIDGSEDVNLPPCCRRHGAHHCAMALRMAAMMRSAQSGKTPIVSAPLTCPYYPGPAATLTATTPALATTPQAAPVMRSFEFVPASAQMSRFSSPLQSHSGRGPPVLSLS